MNARILKIKKDTLGKTQHQKKEKGNAMIPKLVLRSLLAPIFVALLISTIANADNDRLTGRWWHNSQVVKYIKLTDGEIDQLERAFEASRLKMIELKSKVEAEQFILQSLVDKPEIDENAINNQHLKLQAARTALDKERLNYYFNVRKILGYDRFREFEKLRPTKQR